MFVIFICGAFYISTNYFQGIPVLNYHQINDQDHNALTLSNSEFEAQMKYLAKEGYTSITPDELADHLQYNKEVPAKSILITFDDGYKDNYINAYPILQKYNLSATIFLISDFVNTYDRYLNWDEIREMEQGGINFEGHTMSHMVLTQATTDTELQDQLGKSKQALEWRLGKKIQYLAYPCGFYNQHVIDFTKAAGYRAAFTINLGRDTTSSTLYSLNRIPVFGGGTHTFMHFWLRLKFTQIFDSLQNLKAFLMKEGKPSLAQLIYIP